MASPPSAQWAPESASNLDVACGKAMEIKQRISTALPHSLTLLPQPDVIATGRLDYAYGVIIDVMIS